MGDAHLGSLGRRHPYPRVHLHKLGNRRDLQPTRIIQAAVDLRWSRNAHNCRDRTPHLWCITRHQERPGDVQHHGARNSTHTGA